MYSTERGVRRWRRGDNGNWIAICDVSAFYIEETAVYALMKNGAAILIANLSTVAVAQKWLDNWVKESGEKNKI